MSQMLEEQRESWGSRGAFILAAIGSAIGLGNLWAFPYKVYSYGGGAFLIPYIIATIVVGIPLLTLELSLGHFTQRAAPISFRNMHKRLEFVGWWGLLLAFIIITYYPVILGYSISYLWFSIQGIFNGGRLPWAAQGIEGITTANSYFFDTYLGYTEGLGLGGLKLNLVLPLLIAWILMYLAIFKGVSAVGKLVWVAVPLPWIMLLILTVRGLTLEGSVGGLAYYLEPDFSKLREPEIWRYAFGQVFFSLSLAFGVMITYASFLHRKSDINNNAVVIALSNFGTSLIAGLAIFSTLGGMAFVTAQAGDPIPVEEVAKSGPSLAFVAFPYALAQLPYSAWFSAVFFAVLLMLGVSSAFSITETLLASIVDKTGWNRNKVLLAMTGTGFLFGLVYVTHGGLNWLGIIDGFVNGTWGIALMGFLECIIMGWIYNLDILRCHANSRSDWRLGPWWNILIRIVVPVIMGTLFFWSFYDDLAAEGGIFHRPDGLIDPANAIGYSVMLLAPVAAIIISLFRDKYSNDNEETVSTYDLKPIDTSTSVFVVSVAVFAASIFAAFKSAGMVSWHLFAAAALIALVSLATAARKNLFFREGQYTRLDWKGASAGVCSILAVSNVFSLVLIRVAEIVEPSESKAVIGGHLGLWAYLILSLVVLIIVGGLGWCFYRAASSVPSPDTQHSGEVS
ncbi:Na+-dependent transporters of the SNF family protein [Limihaloglobus sulfuriphilus]|uniref:Na+-dependent transporters of the SNF family protein n=1 Tax=Limihaloglobus sulfuriphilus TaxID=1851148 RepID=A0A1Q2MAY6_9BACT|nr:sodium-dependent transporter [Limihaloglobus sulfuriphilus]AQQ69834.1 Na+-dependent transporters of the SNF family protein [Limihaloglobus sulfuriphilus]